MTDLEKLKDPNLTLSGLKGALNQLDKHPENFKKTFKVGVSANITAETFINAFKKESYLL
jgi:hypothetical protein